MRNVAGNAKGAGPTSSKDPCQRFAGMGFEGNGPVLKAGGGSKPGPFAGVIR